MVNLSASLEREIHDKALPEAHAAIAAPSFEQLFSRLQLLRMLALGGLTGPHDAADAAVLFERLADDINAAFPTGSPALEPLREAFRRIPMIRDPDQRLARARGLIDQLTAALTEIESQYSKRSPANWRVGATPGRLWRWIVVGLALCVLLAGRLA